MTITTFISFLINKLLNRVEFAAADGSFNAAIAHALHWSNDERTNTALPPHDPLSIPYTTNG